MRNVISPGHLAHATIAGAMHNSERHSNNLLCSLQGSACIHEQE